MSMNRQTIKDAKAEAKVFIAACDAALERLDHEREYRRIHWDSTTKPGPGDYSYGSKETGTLRRKSMDLTRILAQLRKYSA